VTSIAIPRRSTRPTKDRTRKNRDIRAKEVRVIDPDGEQVGVIPIYKALAIAADFGLDLVEVSPNANPPVCKIMDYGRFKYEQTKKLQEAKKKQTTFQLKEIKVRPMTCRPNWDISGNLLKKKIKSKLRWCSGAGKLRFPS